jgi:DNA-binding HxlR family transcriptional regulator
MLSFEMISSLKNNKISLGEPWRLPKASGFLIPLLNNHPYPERDYVLLQEAENLVDFRDSGGISGVDALNKTGKNVFIRKGTLLKGTGTQSRSPINSFVLTPDKAYKRIPVNCIHQTHRIAPGSKFEVGGLAPMMVYQALGNQSNTWASISEYSHRRQPLETRHLTSSDNLLEVEKIRASDVVEDALETIPGDHLNQVGVVVFDLQGVVAVELFNHPESWRAFSESIIRSYREVLTEEAGELVEVKVERASEIFKAYLEELENLEGIIVAENTTSEVWDLRSHDVTGELTKIEEVEIHLTLNRRDKKQSNRYDNQILRALNLEVTPQPQPSIHIDEPMEQFIQKRGGYNILSTLEETPRRFNELLDEVDVSRGTLATRIKEAEEIGLIEKGIRKTNGSPAYILTSEGKKVKNLGDKKTK